MPKVSQGCETQKAHTDTHPTNSPYTKIRHLSKQRILYIQFSALVKSNARMFNCGGNTHRDRLFRTIPRSAPTFQKPHYPTCFSYGEGLCVLGWLCVLAKPLDTHAKASLLCSPHVCPFIIRQSLTSLFTGSFVSL